MTREVHDSYEALLMCNAMEECGGVPFSVVMERAGGVPATHNNRGLWHVFGRVPEGAYDAVDAQYEDMLRVKP